MCTAAEKVRDGEDSLWRGCWDISRWEGFGGVERIVMGFAGEECEKLVVRMLDLAVPESFDRFSK